MSDAVCPKCGGELEVRNSVSIMLPGDSLKTLIDYECRDRCCGGSFRDRGGRDGSADSPSPSAPGV